MPRLVLHPRHVLVVPCDRDKGSFRYVLSSADGRQ